MRVSLLPAHTPAPHVRFPVQQQAFQCAHYSTSGRLLMMRLLSAPNITRRTRWLSLSAMRAFLLSEAVPVLLGLVAGYLCDAER